MLGGSQERVVSKRQGPESPFPGKEGFGVQKPPFPLVLEKGVFCQKKILFFYKGTHREWGFLDRKLPFSNLCEGEGKWWFLDPKTLFSRKWGFGPLSGVGWGGFGRCSPVPKFFHSKVRPCSAALAEESCESDIPGPQKAERGAHLPKPPFYKTALLFPLEVRLLPAP